MQPSSPKTTAGVTLVELMFTLAVVAILCGFASNAASSAIHAARTSSGLASLIASLTRARSLAANAGVEVVLCPSSNGTECIAGDHWEHGWIAFQGIHGAANRDADEPILLRQAALPEKVHLVSTQGRTRIRFQPSGGNVGSNMTFTFCDGRGAKAASAYAMSNTGNLRATTPDLTNIAAACGG
jgi:type IV fimbrial biogenesis protein FimT